MKIAIVDDDPKDAQVITDYLTKYEEETNSEIQMEVFHSSVEFLERYSGRYDLVFLDIEMPGSNGLEAAREIREKDAGVGIIFVTSLAQYAIAGYEVNAIDYMVKPIRYFTFKVKLEKAIYIVSRKHNDNILVKTKDGIMRLSVSDILWIEKEKE